MKVYEVASHRDYLEGNADFQWFTVERHTVLQAAAWFVDEWTGDEDFVDGCIDVMVREKGYDEIKYCTVHRDIEITYDFVPRGACSTVGCKGLAMMAGKVCEACHNKQAGI